MEPIRLSGPNVAGAKVEFTVTAPRRFQRFLNGETFWVEYDESVADCPDGVLVVAPVATLAPVAWAAGRSIAVAELDATFAESLQRLLPAYRDQYPSIFTADVDPVRFERTREYDVPTRPSPSDTGLLFSGGVDSLTSYANHREESPALFTIHGSDLDLANEAGWRRVRRSVEAFAGAEGVPVHTIRSNFREVLAYFFLDHTFATDVHQGWWEAIHYGTALPALCAPIAFRDGYRYVYQGSGYNADPSYPTAQPSFVHELRWDETQARITELDMTRQEKLDYLSENLDTFERTPTIRSCYSDASGANCAACPKCRRTILGLCLAGVDPNDVGFDVDQSVFAAISDDIEAGDLVLDEVSLYFWREMQRRASERESIVLADDDFLEWFRSINLASVGAGTGDGTAWDRLTVDRIKAAVVSLPYPLDALVWSLARPAKRRLPV